MVKGIEIFRERFRGFPDSLVLIGGAACDEWFSRLGMTFRATRDLDIVLILEAVTDNFVSAMRAFSLMISTAWIWMSVAWPVAPPSG